MKTSLRLSFLATALAVAPHLSAADRWSPDEMAVRMGVRSWLTWQARGNPQTSSTEAKALFVSLPAAQALQATTGSVPAVQPENVSVQLHGDRAVTSFQLQQPSAQVVLQWERRSGLWKVAQETVKPSPDSAERVALSDSLRK